MQAILTVTSIWTSSIKQNYLKVFAKSAAGLKAFEMNHSLSSSRMTKDSVKNLKNIHNRASKKNIIATFALDILMATADTYVAVSQLLEVRLQLAGQRVSFRAVLVRHKSDFLHHISDKL